MLIILINLFLSVNNSYHLTIVFINFYYLFLMILLKIFENRKASKREGKAFRNFNQSDK